MDSEALRIGLEPDPLAALEAWGDAVDQRYHPPLWHNIPGGWLGWSWVDPLYSELYENVVHRNIRAVRNRLKLDENHVQYVWVNVGNLKDELLPGNWLSLRRLRPVFPAARRPWCRTSARTKFTLGLWTGMFWMSAKITDEVEELKNAWLKYQGKPIVIVHRDLGPMYVPDPTHPKTQEFIHRVYSTYRKWGVRYYMLDFTDAIAGSTPGTHPNDGYYDKTKINGPDAWRRGYRAIRAATERRLRTCSACVATFPNIGFSQWPSAWDRTTARAAPSTDPTKAFTPARLSSTNPTTGPPTAPAFVP